MQKDFDGWNNLKKKIDDKNSNELKNIFCREREIWFCSIGLNIGSEQNGRNESFERHVLIFKKVSAETFLVLPLTSNKKSGSWYFELKEKDSSVIIPQIRLLDVRRLNRKIRTLPVDEFDDIKKRVKEYL